MPKPKKSTTSKKRSSSPKKAQSAETKLATLLAGAFTILCIVFLGMAIALYA